MSFRSQDHDPSPSRDECLALRDACDHPSAGAVCADCVLYGQAVATARSEPTPLPDALRDRLRAVARDADPIEREIDRVLAHTVAEARVVRPLPPALRERLRRLPERHETERHTTERHTTEPVPWWIADSRWAGAACVLLTAALTLAAGDASARFQELQTSSQRLQRTTVGLTVELKTDLEKGLKERVSGWTRELDALPPARSAEPSAAPVEISIGLRPQTVTDWIPDGLSPGELRSRGEAAYARALALVESWADAARARVESATTGLADRFETSAFLDREQGSTPELDAREAWNDPSPAPVPSDNDTERNDP